MKKAKFLPLIFLISVLLLSSLAPCAIALSEPDIASRAAVIMDRNSDQVFYSKNADQMVYPASTTKIMTVLLAIEAIEAGNVSIYDEVTAPADMTYDLADDGSTAGIVVGETMTLQNFLYCAMISSANEACNVIAEYIGGTIPNFIDMMNARAKELGCTYTHFANTHGLPDSDHYTTADDFCKIAMEASRHDLFMEICGTASVEVPATNKSEARMLHNSNALISSESMYGGKYIYEYAAGIKTGYTSDAGYCLVSTASSNGIDLLAVVFGGSGYTADDGTMSYTNFEDSITLYDWVFNNFSYQSVLNSTDIIASAGVSLGSDGDSVNLRPETSLSALLPNDLSPSDFDRDIVIYSEQSGEALVAPIVAGQVLGEVTVSKDGVNYGAVKLVASTTVELSHAQFIKNEIKATLRKPVVNIVLAVLVLLIALYVFLVVRYRVIHNRRRKAALAARAEREQRARTQQVKAPPQENEPEISFFTPNAPAAPKNAPPAQQAAKPASRPKPIAEPAPKAAAAPAESSAPAEAPEVEEDPAAKAERDYFEEFFRHK